MEEPTTESQLHSWCCALTTHCPPYILLKTWSKKVSLRLLSGCQVPGYRNLRKEHLMSKKTSTGYLPSGMPIWPSPFFICTQRACLCVLGKPLPEYFRVTLTVLLDRTTLRWKVEITHTLKLKLKAISNRRARIALASYENIQKNQVDGCLKKRSSIFPSVIPNL